MTRWLFFTPSILVAGLVTTLLSGCSSSPRVERIDAEQITDLSGDWNDTDSRLVSAEMVQDVLAQRWLAEFQRAEGDSPAVIVGRIRNRTHEHINVATFVADIERELINSGRVRFVASGQERGQIREEREDQDLHAREETRNPMGQELGADFMLAGTISSIIDAVRSKQTRYYQVDLTLIDLADNRKVWIGQKKIKKDIQNRKLRP